jgi:hypothetical protein
MHGVSSSVTARSGMTMHLCMSGDIPCNLHLDSALVAVGAAAEVQAIMQDDAADIADSNSDDFWVLAAALKRFVEDEGRGSLPLEASCVCVFGMRLRLHPSVWHCHGQLLAVFSPARMQLVCRSCIGNDNTQGSIPDMTATTTAYLQLQHVYRERADADVAAVEAHAGRILAAQGRSPAAIPHAAVRTFCKNASNIRWVPIVCRVPETCKLHRSQEYAGMLINLRRVLRYRSLADEVGTTNGNSSNRGTPTAVRVMLANRQRLNRQEHTYGPWTCPLVCTQALH